MAAIVFSEILRMTKWINIAVASLAIIVGNAPAMAESGALQTHRVASPCYNICYDEWDRILQRSQTTTPRERQELQETAREVCNQQCGDSAPSPNPSFCYDACYDKYQENIQGSDSTKEQRQKWRETVRGICHTQCY